jgi:hypothetical protein
VATVFCFCMAAVLASLLPYPWRHGSTTTSYTGPATLDKRWAGELDAPEGIDGHGTGYRRRGCIS